jgi:hypothetical protein
MKLSVVSLGLLSMLFLSCHTGHAHQPSPERSADTANYTTIQWLDSVVNFGSIPMGEQVKVVFRFRNSGNNPLYNVP